MTRDNINLGLLPVEHTGKYDLPTLAPQSIELPDTLIPFNKAKTNYNKNVGVHFFIDDYQFERVWRSPQLYLEMLRPYKMVLAPDFSLYLDIPMAVKIWNVYRSRLIAHYWQQQGLNIIPTLQWAEPRTFEFCFDGIPKNGIVAVSTLGAAKHRVSRELWKMGMKEAIKRLHPKTILLYGRQIDFDYGDIQVVSYSNETIERMKHYGK